jgi:hypothetical protein
MILRKGKIKKKKWIPMCTSLSFREQQITLPDYSRRMEFTLQ